jgi:hypothetical protein
MTTSVYKQAVITALKSKAHLVGQVASELGILYDEAPVSGRNALMKFPFIEVRLLADRDRSATDRWLCYADAPGCTRSRRRGLPRATSRNRLS